MNAMTETRTRAETEPKLSTMLSQLAVVARITTTSLGLSRTDRAASRQSAEQHGAKPGVSKVTVSRLAGAEARVKEIKDIAEDAQGCLTSLTTVWGDKRLLTNVNIEKFLGRYAPINERYRAAVQRFIEDAPAMIEAARDNKGTYQVTPPTMEEIRQAFSMTMELEAIADGANYRPNGLNQVLEQHFRRAIESQVEAAYAAAERDAVERLAGPLANLVERMTSYSQRQADIEAGKEVDRHSGTFKDTIIENVQQIGAVFGSFNLTGNPVLARVAEQLKTFESLTAADLRKHQATRDLVKTKAEAILKDLGDWLD